MNLSTGKVIYPRRVTVIPMTKSIIKIVEQMGLDQGIKSLKIKSRCNNILYPINWRPGIEYDEYHNEDDEEYIPIDEKMNMIKKNMIILTKKKLMN